MLSLFGKSPEQIAKEDKIAKDEKLLENIIDTTNTTLKKIGQDKSLGDKEISNNISIFNHVNNYLVYLIDYLKERIENPAEQEALKLKIQRAQAYAEQEIKQIEKVKEELEKVKDENTALQEEIAEMSRLKRQFEEAEKELRQSAEKVTEANQKSIELQQKLRAVTEEVGRLKPVAESAQQIVQKDQKLQAELQSCTAGKQEAVKK